MDNWLAKNVAKVIDEEGKPVRVLRNSYGYEITESDWTHKYRRVTTVLGGMPKPALKYWAAAEVAKYAWERREALALMDKAGAIKALKGAPWENRDQAGVRGTHVHDALDDYHKGKVYHEGLNKEETEMVNNTIRLLQNRNATPLGSEVIVYNKTLNYAGTFDLWDIGRGPWICDYKTSKGIYPNNALQLTAYQNAEFAVLNMKKVRSADNVDVFEGTRIPWDKDWGENLAIIHVKEKESLFCPIVPREEYWKTFKASAQIKGFMLDTDSYKGKTPRVQVYQNAITSEGVKNYDQ